MAVLNMRLVETTPGADRECPFSPPAGWEGDEKAYRQLLWERYATDLQAVQRMVVQARFARQMPVDYRGPFAEMARRMVDYINSPH